MDKYAMNEIFRTRLEEGPEGVKIAAEAGKAYIKDRLREESFARKILPPEMISKSELQRNEDNDGFYKLVDLEPDSSAMAMNFRAEAPSRYVTGKRYRINFFKVESERCEKNEAELLAYEMPITKIIEQNSVFDIQAVEDSVFYKHAVASVSGTSRDGVNTGVTITRKDIADSKSLILSQKIKPYSIVMTEEMFTSVEGWDYQYLGDDLLDQVTVSGYDKPTLVNLSLIVTNKADLVNYREFWLFAKPEFLGNFYIMEDTKFWIDKRADMVEWKSWEWVGMGFGNIKGVARVTFTG